MNDGKITVSPFYNSAVNAVTQPDEVAWCSKYFIDRWLPALGGEGTRIVLALRRKGYNNRKRGQKREDIKISLPELAALVGCSEDTIERQIDGVNKKTGKPHNPYLNLFVRKFQNKKRDPRSGKLWQEENGYWISMDDPVHPDDWPLVAEYVRTQETLREKVSGPVPHFAEPVREPVPQNAESKPQNAPPVPQNAESKPQNAERLIRYDSDSYTLLKTPNTPAAPGDSLSLFSKKEAAPQQVIAWEDFPEDQRPFWEEKARQLFVINGVSTPGARAVSRQAVAIWQKDMRQKGDGK